MTLAGRTIVMHHFYDWLQPTDMIGADVIISGHDHRPRIEHREGRLWINPGECCGWRYHRRTIAWLDLTTLQAEIVDLPAC